MCTVRHGVGSTARLDGVDVAFEQEADSTLGRAAGKIELGRGDLADRERGPLAVVKRVERDAEDRPALLVGVEGRGGGCERLFGGLRRFG